MQPEAQKKPGSSAMFGRQIGKNWLVRLFRVHAFINLFRTLRREIIMKDLFNLRQPYYPATIDSRYRKAMEKPLPNWKCMRQYWLMYVLLFRVFLMELVLVAVLGIITAGLGYSGPLFIKEIMNFIRDPTPTQEQQSRAYRFAGVWMVMYFLRIMFNEHTLWRCYATSLKVEQLLGLLIFDKVMKMSALSRQYLDQGDFLTYFSVDNRNIFLFIRSFSVFFSAPTTLILAQVFIYFETGVYGTVLTGTIAFSLILLIFLSYRIAKYGLKKFGYYNRRLTFNLEAMLQLKQIKSLGWEELIASKNREFRQPQNKNNKKAYFLVSIYNFIVNFSAPLVLLVIFLLNLSIPANSFKTTHVYTVITYTYLIVGPLGSLPTSISYFLQALASCRRIAHFLLSAETKRVETYGLENGGVKISNLVGRWDDEISKEHFRSSDRQFNKKIFLKSSKNVGYTVDPMGTERSLRSQNSAESSNMILRVPFYVRLAPGERLIVLGETGESRYGLAEAFLGHLNTLQGEISYGGKIGYMSQIPFVLIRETIQANVLFGEPFDQKKLNLIYRLVHLEESIQTLKKGDQTVLEEISTLLSLSFRQKLALARTLYYNPDIFFFDNAIDGVDIESLSAELEIFDTHVKGKTLIITTRSRNFLRPTDKILIFSGETAIEYGSLTELLRNPNSLLNFWEQRKEVIMETNHQGKGPVRPDELLLQKQCSVKQVQHSMPEDDFSAKQVDKIEPETDKATKSDPESSKKVQKRPRPTNVSWRVYWKVIKAGSFWLCLMSFVFTVLAQTLNVFSYWWIGFARVGFRSYPSNLVIGVYIGVVLGYGLLLFLSTVVLPYISVGITENISEEIIGTLTAVDMSWIEKQNKAFSAGIVGRDNEQMFWISTWLQGIVNNTCFYIGTFVLSAYSNPLFLAVGVPVIIINFLTILVYASAEREIFPMIGLGWRRYNTLAESCILGVDTIVSMGKMEYFRHQFMDAMYWVVLCRANNRLAIQGLSMVCDLTGLIATFATSAFAISAKPTNNPRINSIGGAISMSNKLISLSSRIARDIGTTQAQMRISVVIVSAMQRNPLLYAGMNQEKGYHQPAPPMGWPTDNSIELVGVSHQHEQFSKPSLNNLSVSFGSSEKVAVYDSIGDTVVQTLFMLLTKLKEPKLNGSPSGGRILVGGVPIDLIGRKYLKEVVAIIDDHPFIFTGSLRENIDPFGRYSDAQIIESMVRLGLWEQLPLGEQHQDRLQLHIHQGAANVSLGHQQLINMARMYLRQPKILLRSYSGSAASLKQRFLIRETTFRDFQHTTMLISSQDMLTFMRCNRVVGFQKGRILEDGEPHQLFYRENTHYHLLIKQLDHKLYEYLQNHREMPPLHPIMPN